MDKISLIALQSLHVLQKAMPADDEALKGARLHIDGLIPELRAFIQRLTDLEHKAWEDARVMKGSKGPCACPKCDFDNHDDWSLAFEAAVKAEAGLKEESAGVSESKGRCDSDDGVCLSCGA